MNIHVRLATKEDAPFIAPLIVDAIGEIANRVTGETNAQAVLHSLEQLFLREDNRHSYKHTYIADYNGEVAGMMVIYGGDEAITLDANLEKWLAAKNAPVQKIEVEAREDELYIDTICVSPNYRGKGIGTILLNYAEKLVLQKNYPKLSLSVEKEKVRARHLYEKMGYVYAEPWMIIGEEFDHLVKIFR